MSVTVSTGDRVSINLGASQVLTVTGGVGTVRGVAEALSWTITDGVTTSIGPYTDSKPLLLLCTTGPITYTLSPADLALVPYRAMATVTFSPAAGATNVCEVTIAAKQADGTAYSGVVNMDLWLSDAATGAGITGTTASGAVAAKAASGYDVAVVTAKKWTRIQTLADGTYILSITDSAKTGFYVAAGVGGKTFVSTQLTSASYGA